MDFEKPTLFDEIIKLDEAQLDALSFGVIGMDLDGNVELYNETESRYAGLSHDRVIGKHFFSEVAPCTNNFMVSGRFEDEDALDEIIDYVFTLRMKPTNVELRMLKSAPHPRQYLLVRRR